MIKLIQSITSFFSLIPAVEALCKIPGAGLDKSKCLLEIAELIFGASVEMHPILQKAIDIIVKYAKKWGAFAETWNVDTIIGDYLKTKVVVADGSSTTKNS